MNLQTVEIEEGDDQKGQQAFEKYFNDKDLFELFKFDESNNCATLDLIMKRDGFKFLKTPTNIKHIKYM